MKKAICGKKIGMTQIIDENGNVVPVTVVETYDGHLITKKTLEKDSYSAYVFGFIDIKETKLNKPTLGLFNKSKVSPKKIIKEFKFSEEPSLSNDILNIDQFETGDILNVYGKSNGKGFQGTVKSHGFSRGLMTHGSKSHRLPGSIGAGTDPARVYLGTKMAKKLGNKRVTLKNLKLIKVDKENNILYIKGSIPGKKNKIIYIYN